MHKIIKKLETTIPTNTNLTISKSIFWKKLRKKIKNMNLSLLKITTKK